MTPYLITSASPASSSRRGSVRQHVDVGEHAARLVERADQVLALRVVHRGLAADRGVDLRQQRGGHLHDREAAQQRGGREAAEVADDAAAERDERRPALDARLEQAIVDEREPGEALVLLAVRDLDDDRDRSPRPGASATTGSR